MLIVKLFGNVSISTSTPAAQPNLMPLPQALLAYLVLHSHQLHTREALIDVFWGDLEPARARAALNTALWRIRAAIEPAGESDGRYLLSANDSVGFNGDGDAWVDVHVFARRVASLTARPAHLLTGGETTELATALALYHGDLLDGMYWDWILPQRERLRLMVLDAMTLLLHVHALHCRYAEGIRWGRRILDLDPLRESVHRDLMRLQCANGQRGLALRCYEMCRQILWTELRIEPMPQTRALFDQIVAGDELGPGPWAPATRSERPRHTAAPISTPPASITPSPFRDPVSDPPSDPRTDAARRNLERIGVDIEDVVRLMRADRSSGALHPAQAS
ncbi:MAG: BTAD domain-containing putative transcriptional regulator [Ardenticatenales bacterium]